MFSNRLGLLCVAVVLVANVAWAESEPVNERQCSSWTSAPEYQEFRAASKKIEQKYSKDYAVCSTPGYNGYTQELLCQNAADQVYLSAGKQLGEQEAAARAKFETNRNQCINNARSNKAKLEVEKKAQETQRKAQEQKAQSPEKSRQEAHSEKPKANHPARENSTHATQVIDCAPIADSAMHGTSIPDSAPLTEKYETKMYLTKKAMQRVDAECASASDYLSIKQSLQNAYEEARAKCESSKLGPAAFDDCVAINHFK